MLTWRRRFDVPISIAIILSLLVGTWLSAGITAVGGSASRPEVPVTSSVTLVGGGHGTPAGSPDRGAPLISGAAPRASGSVSPVVTDVERGIAGGWIDPRDVFLPSSFTHARGPAPGSVSPTTTSVPAPMGLADLGLGSTGSYVYNTSSFAATLGISAFSAYSPGYPGLAEAPDWTAIQLNTVATRIAYPGANNGTFWIQNVVHFNGSSLQFEDNIWNFSSMNGAFASNAILQSNGRLFSNDFYFYTAARVYTVTDPFTLTLYNNLTNQTVGGLPRSGVYFNFTISDSAGFLRGSYDHVVFSGNAAVAPQFEVNGGAYNPFGLLYDAEIIIGGDGSGANANIATLAGSLTLSSWNSTGGRYDHIRSAYDFGPDTGETSMGVATYFQGPGGTEYLNPGPSMLYGLWNTTNRGFAPAASPHWIHVQVTLTPIYAFLFATSNASFARPLPQANLSYVPSSVGGVATTDLPQPTTGTYVFAAWANGYSTGNVSISNNTTGIRSLILAADPAVVDAPVYLTGSAQAAAYGAARIPQTGYDASNGTLWLNASFDPIAPPFLRVNDFTYPTFVLFAEDGVDSSILLDGFNQSSSAFTYTSYNSTRSIPGWTQGYYFFGGRGHFAVANTNLTGNTLLYYAALFPIVSAGAIEFFETAGSHATGIVVSQDSDGVTVVNSTSTTISRVTSTTGSLGVTASNSTYLHAGPLSATGTDSLAGPSRAAFLANDTHVDLSALSAANGGTALELANVTYWNTTGIQVINGATGVEAQYSSHGQLSGLVVQGASLAGSWSNSSFAGINGIFVAGSFGFDLAHMTSVTASNVSVSGAAALGVPATGIASFDNSTGGTFTNVSATNISIAFNATESSYVNLSLLNATGGSIGATLFGVNHVRASGLNASNQSVALSWQVGNFGTIVGGALGNSSVGVALQNVTSVSISGLTANESSLAPPYFFSPATGFEMPTAPVALDNVTKAFVGNITANEYPFGVWANYTNASTIYNVWASNGGIGVELNVSARLQISQLFAYGNFLGLVLFNTTLANVTSSTLEDSVGWGIAILNSSKVNVIGNNFVANNNSSASGGFNPAHEQAYTNNTTLVRFSTTVGNYWSDYSGVGLYPVHNNTGDALPYGAFLYNRLEFNAHGLPAGTAWGILVLGVDFSSLDPLFYIPSYDVPIANFRFAVNVTPGYFPSPVRGPIAFTGANQTVNINFVQVVYTVQFTASGLPIGKSWSVTFGGIARSNTTSVAGGSISFVVPNATYPYSIVEPGGWVQRNLPVVGSLPVAGSGLTETLAFSAYTYNVTFSAGHLPVGALWSITFNGTIRSTTGGSLVFAVPNGTYPYSVGAISGWSETTIPAAGSIVVRSASVARSVIFAPTYQVTFTETGLALGTKWSISLNGTSRNSTGTTIVFNLTNATYGYSVPTVGNLSAPGGRTTVQGQAVFVTLAFAPIPPSSGSSFPWLYVGAGLAAVAVVLALGALMIRRRRRSGPAQDDPLLREF